MTRVTPPGSASDGPEIEAPLVDWVAGIAPIRPQGPGRPPLLAATVLWMSLTIGVRRGAMSQTAIWRLVVDQGLGRERHVWVTDEAVYKRLAQATPSPMATRFAQLTPLVQARVEPQAQHALAPFATDVGVRDATTLEPVARTRPGLREVPAGADVLRPGKLAGVCDVRRQLWRTLEQIANPHQNEKGAARELVATLAPGTLILAALGYLGFAWFAELTEAGHFWLSRLRANTRATIAHVHYDDGRTFDGLIWLGKHRANRATHLGRLVRFRQGELTHSYVTNVRDPRLFTLPEIATVSARRGDIELALKLVQRELGLAVLCSAKPAVIAHQVWAVLLIAHILTVLRFAVAAAAGVDLCAVSRPLLIRSLPQYAAYHDDPLRAFVADGPQLGFMRPARRLQPPAPLIPAKALSLPPPDLGPTQVPRYPGRTCGPNRPDRRH
jgi:hypothetical protein